MKVAQVCGSHCVAEAPAKVLCLDCKRHDAEAVGVEASRLLLRAGTRTVQARDFGCVLVASGMETGKGLGRMRGTGTKERVRLLVSVVGMMVREKQLADNSALVGTTVREKVLENKPGSSLVVQEKPRASTADSLSVAQAKLLESIARSL